MIDQVGWMITEPVIPNSVINRLSERLTPLLKADFGYSGVRNLLEEAEVRELARSEPVRAIAESILGSFCFVVRGIFFDKTPEANWKVIWHQDLTIAVQRRLEVSGFGPWTKKRVSSMFNHRSKF